MAALIGGCRGRPMSSRARLGRSHGKLGAAAGVGGILRKAGQLFLRREGRRFKTLFPLEQAEPISPTGGIAGGRGRHCFVATGSPLLARSAAQLPLAPLRRSTAAD